MTGPGTTGPRTTGPGTTGPGTTGPGTTGPGTRDGQSAGARARSRGGLRPLVLLGKHLLVVMVRFRDRLAGNLAERGLDLRLLVRVGHLAVQLDVAREQDRVGLPELHEQPDPAQDQERDQAVPDDHSEGRARLEPQLLRVAVEQAGGGD